MSDANTETLRTYERAAELYRERTVRCDDDPDDLVPLVAAHTPAGAHVLEVGSGPGHDAARLESRGFRVRRTDATVAFVEMHIDRPELPRVLARLRDAVRPGGLLAMTLKEGDGEEWSSHKVDLPRHFTYWREEPLRTVLVGAGWEPVVVERPPTTYGR